MDKPEQFEVQSRWFRDPALRYAVTVFLALRVVLSVFAALILLLNPSSTEQDTYKTYLGFTPVTEGWEGLLLEPWQRFDTLHYLRIAAEGYDASPEDTVFAPLYPALIRSLGLMLDGNYLFAALLISNIAAFAALFLLFKLVEFELDRSAARRATLYLVVSPVAFFLFAGYSESLYLALSIAAIYFVRQARWGCAGLMAFLAAWTRTSGWILVFPFLYEYIHPRHKLRPSRTALFSVAAAPLGLAMFLLYRYLAGYPPLEVLYTTYWRSRVVPPWVSILVASRHILSGSGHPADIFDLCLTFVFIGLTIAAWRRLPTVYTLYLGVGILFPLTRLKVPLYPLQSQSRYLLTLFPAFMVLAQVGERPWVNRVILYPSIALLLFWTGQFVMWGWVA